MDLLIFKYVDGTVQVQAFLVNGVKGLDEPDAVEFVPPLQLRTADGTLRTYFKKFRRIITVTMGVLQDSGDRDFIFNWLKAKEKTLKIGALADVGVALYDPTTFSNTWLYDSNTAPHFEFKLRELAVHSDWPTGTAPTTDTLMYIKTKVQITGTPDSPQTFTTNTSPLTSDDTGEAYPEIDLTLYAVTVIPVALQEAGVKVVADSIVQNGTDIDFELFHDNSGNPAGDGLFYATIVIGLQAKP